MQGGGSPAPGYGLTSAATTQGSASALETTSLETQGDLSDLSHLDTFFANSGWTRDDVLVVAAVANVSLWLILLYLEVSE